MLAFQRLIAGRVSDVVRGAEGEMIDQILDGAVRVDENAVAARANLEKGRPTRASSYKT